ncbi:hypothetical protein [Shewanella glacialipiscicola]|uniref:Uncharacterized protein n=1 Tax=Shewanella glacialipiscicola TaxID=614069 RepID=A0ABQ6J616_9GAMM|nr:hypothetical protein [Shewanella glacialipiscicola]MCL1084762.1 hypothetical protein [Shewanella glacialipiscicola]GMA82285.1 hypothetical protein GCM10025855_18180 [Shewanella glacialipiscicola]
MFERLEVLSGDIDRGFWAIDRDGIKNSGFLSISRKIKYSEIELLTKTEQISNVVYIEIKLITGETANAKLDVKYYSILYDNYTKAKPSSVSVDSTCSNDLKITDNVHDKENALDLWSVKPSSKMNDGTTKVSSSQSNEQRPVKERSTENLVWWLVGIIFMLFLFSGEYMGDNSSSTSEEPSASQTNPNVDAQVYCKIALEDAATYGAKVPWGSNTVVVPYEDGRRYRVAMDAEIKNAYGTWGKSRISCIVNGEQVTELIVGGEVIYN